MPRRILPPYKCIRCEYTTQFKNDMRRHLYKNKLICPALFQNIELTDDIKDNILTNRMYHEPMKEPEKGVTQIINNNNIITNFISSMDTMEKVQKYFDFNGVQPSNIENVIDYKYAKRILKLEKGEYANAGLNRENFLEIVDEVSNAHKSDLLSHFNIYYNAKSDKLHIYDDIDEEWIETLPEKGCKRILHSIQCKYWNSYEKYLLSKIHNNGVCQETMKFIEYLEEYYKFLGCFDVQPYCKDRDNTTILQREVEDSFSLSEIYYKKYKGIYESLSKAEKKDTKKEVLDIIKNNSKRNIDELNKRVIDLFNMDQEFKDTILRKQPC